LSVFRSTNIQFLNKIMQNLRKAKVHHHKKVQIVPKKDHPIVQAHISKQALTVLTRLHQAGFQAYLVGGSVRDLLVGLKPKDFDVATDAHPEQVHRIFRNSRLIGRRFKLVHVFFGREIIEVATFRAHHPETSHPEGHQSATGMLMRDNIYGTMEEDAWRRDFSINALYFDVSNFSVLDPTGGMEDLAQGIIRILGNPIDRYKEDPVRMIRALRIAAKLNFKLEPHTANPIFDLKTNLTHVSHARLFEELIKLFHSGHANKAFDLLRHYELFAILFPLTEETLSQEPEHALKLMVQSCKNTDARIAQGQSLNPGFLMAVLLWPPVQQRAAKYKEQGHKPYGALLMAMNQVITEQTPLVAIPRRFTLLMKEIWLLQTPLEQRLKRRISGIFNHPRFRAAFDFLALRSQAGEPKLHSVVQWWQSYQDVSPAVKEEMLEQLAKGKAAKK
jgi:poly(A) polymerase